MALGLGPFHTEWGSLPYHNVVTEARDMQLLHCMSGAVRANLTLGPFTVRWHTLIFCDQNRPAVRAPSASPAQGHVSQGRQRRANVDSGRDVEITFALSKTYQTSNSIAAIEGYTPATTTPPLVSNAPSSQRSPLSGTPDATRSPDPRALHGLAVSESRDSRQTNSIRCLRNTPAAPPRLSGVPAMSIAQFLASSPPPSPRPAA